MPIIYNNSTLTNIYYDGDKLKKVYLDGNLVFGSNGFDISNITPLSTARHRLAATTVGNYALFAGGFNSGNVSTVDAYNISLTRSIPTVLSAARYELSATTVGNYALFAGGHGVSNNDPLSTVDVYNTSLTRSTATVLSVARGLGAATTVGNYALFAGGFNGSTYINGVVGYNYIATVDAYNTSLTRSTPVGLSVARGDGIGATTVGNYALFAGGGCTDTSGYPTCSSIVDTYNKSLTRGTAPNISGAPTFNMATSVGNYAIVASRDVIDAYNSTLTKNIVRSSGLFRVTNGAATTVGNYALFAGAAPHQGDYNNINVIDSSLTYSCSNDMVLNVYRYELAATTVGNYALFAGGRGATQVTQTMSDRNEVEAISIG